MAGVPNDLNLKKKPYISAGDDVSERLLQNRGPVRLETLPEDQRSYMKKLLCVKSPRMRRMLMEKILESD